MTAKKPTILTHPESNAKVETLEPEAYLSQGWTEQDKPAASKD